MREEGGGRGGGWTREVGGGRRGGRMGARQQSLRLRLSR